MQKNVRSTRLLLVRGLLCAAVVNIVSAPGSSGAENQSSAPPSLGPLFSLVGDFLIGQATNRTDYESLDPAAHRLYIAKMGEGKLIVFDTERNRLLNELDGFPKVTGVLAVPELHRIYASVPGSGVVSSILVGLGMIGLSSGNGEIVTLDSTNLEESARLAGGVFPDGIAYDPADRRIFISDEFGGAVIAIDAVHSRVLARIDTGGEAGNVQYDSVSARTYVAVQSRDELAVVDPTKLSIVARYRLEGCKHPHGLVVPPQGGIGYVACDDNDVLLVVDLATGKVLCQLPVAHDPDVMAIDRSASRLYVATESGNLSSFDLGNPRAPVDLGNVFVGEGAHAVAVDSTTHRLYFALANVKGQAVLRVIAPSNH